jgi:hypothetical protein
MAAPLGNGADHIEANQLTTSSLSGRELAISELPFALHYTASRAVQFAEMVFDMDREFEDGLDWAGRVQARCYAPYASLYRCLPPSLPEPVRREAERMLAHG